MSAEEELVKKLIHPLEVPFKIKNQKLLKLTYEVWKRQKGKQYRCSRKHIKALRKMDEREAFITWEYIQCFMSLSENEI